MQQSSVHYLEFLVLIKSIYIYSILQLFFYVLVNFGNTQLHRNEACLKLDVAVKTVLWGKKRHCKVSQSSWVTHYLTPLFKTPLPSCSSHAGLLTHLSLRRRRAVPAGMVENGNSRPRRSGKFEIGAWLAESREAGSLLLPSLGTRQGCCIFPS